MRALLSSATKYVCGDKSCCECLQRNTVRPVVSVQQQHNRHFNSTYSVISGVMPPVPVLKAGVAGAVIPPKERVVIATDSHTNEDAAKLVELFKHLGEMPMLVQVGDGTQAGALLASVSRKSLPVAFVKGNCVGDMQSVEKLHSNGILAKCLEQHDYDLIVLGGGSGGLAAAKEAASFGFKVACLDFVKPTPVGTTWGLGGTCVNVGCIPKKLMHQASLLGHHVHDAKLYGWQLPEQESPAHSWDTLRQAVQDHIGSLNWGYRVQLREKSVTYINSYGSFIDSHTIKAVNKRGKEETLTADRFLISTGLRPRYPDVPGAKEYCITSDDLFSLEHPPGKTLCVGASYVSLECAGFAKGLGFDTTVMVRSILLRGFDQDMAERIGAHMEEQGVRFIRETVPVKFERLKEGKPGLVRVTAKGKDGTEIVEDYNTVVLAIGRNATTEDMGLSAAGVQVNPKNNKVLCLPGHEQSASAPWVYAVGDVLDGGPELTPVAVQAGKLLMKRLFDGSLVATDYAKVPTTVFTPLEYGACGLSEEEAVAKFGEDRVEVYHARFNPLEHTVSHNVDAKHCYAKLVCHSTDDMRVVGLHLLSPNAGEITQGFAMALQMNATKADFDRLIGIHPTVAEVFTTMAVTKREQAVIEAAGC